MRHGQTKARQRIDFVLQNFFQYVLPSLQPITHIVVTLSYKWCERRGRLFSLLFCEWLSGRMLWRLGRQLNITLPWVGSFIGRIVFMFRLDYNTVELGRKWGQISVVQESRWWEGACFVYYWYFLVVLLGQWIEHGKSCFGVDLKRIFDLWSSWWYDWYIMSEYVM